MPVSQLHSMVSTGAQERDPHELPSSPTEDTTPDPIWQHWPSVCDMVERH